MIRGTLILLHMGNRPEYLEFVLEQLSPLGAVTSRAMFGGHCLYVNGIVFALLANNELYLKADGETRPRFEQRKLKPFRPFDKEDFVMSYYQAPPEIFEDRDAMREWAGAAVETGRRAKKGPKKSRGRQI